MMSLTILEQRQLDLADDDNAKSGSEIQLVIILHVFQNSSGLQKFFIFNFRLSETAYVPQDLDNPYHSYIAIGR